ncbi:MAG TPA: hypothetical protein VF175_03460 [Lacipirellula sp.]
MSAISSRRRRNLWGHPSPGRGVTSDGDAAKQPTFHYWGDPQTFIGLSGTATVDATALTPSSTQFDSSYTLAEDRYFLGRALIFTDGALSGRVASIIAYGLVGGRGRFTVRGLAAAPAGGDAFSVIGPPIPCYRPSDATIAGSWYLRETRQSGAETDCKIRVYVPSGTPSLEVFGGAGSPNSHTLAPGWQTIISRLTKAQMADLSGPFVRLLNLNGDAYVAWVEVERRLSMTPRIVIETPSANPEGSGTEALIGAATGASRCRCHRRKSAPSTSPSLSPSPWPPALPPN